MLIPLLYFLLFLFVWAVVAYVLTNRGMTKRWTRTDPASVARHIRYRNRGALIGTLAGLVVAAIFEGLVPAVSDLVQDLQYLVGDGVAADPVWFLTTTAGTISWGFYLAIFLGTLAGLIIGTLMAVKKYPILSGLSPRSLF